MYFKFRRKRLVEFEQVFVTVDGFFLASMGNYRISIRIEHKESGAVEKVAFDAQNYFVN